MGIDSPFSLKGKKLLITGASSGIGRAIAVECSNQGALVAITARDETRLNETYSLLLYDGHIKIIADLTNEIEIDKLVSEVQELDGIVHSAGIINPKPFNFLTRDELSGIMDTNFFGPVLLMNKLLRKKKVKHGASVVFISSISGVMISAVGGSAYSASKGALNGAIKGMAVDLAPKRIRVNSVIPGMIETEFFTKTSISKQELGSDMKKYPLGRYGKPEEVAWATIFLLSDASSWMTGSNLLLDGGFTLL